MTTRGDWDEIAAGVFVAVAEPASVNLGLVVGERAALLVDTGSTPEQGRRLRESLAAVTPLPVAAVVVTHWHYDHAFGLAAFDDDPAVRTLAHESVPQRLRSVEAIREAQRLGVDPAALALPREDVVVARALDLGGRRIEVAHLGAGHTDGDLVIVVPDADVLFTGDLVESAGAPWFGEDSAPHAWGATLDGVIGLMTATSRAVPGHGEPVDRQFVFGQRSELAAVSGEIRRLVDEGVSASEALRRGSWPFPEEHVAAGVLRGHRELTAGGSLRRPPLPLV